ncbi:MAG: CBS domain-containing protein [Gammaproteobacteria bacterium]|nr:CBS domain-containing protein [Gammaproteobacteria bacterium]
MKVGEIMSTDPVTVGMDDDLHRVKDLFDLYRFHHLLVLLGERLAGVISDRDLLRATSPFIGRASERPQDVATLNRRVHQIMTRKLVVVDPEAPVEEAARLMLDRRVSCLPVVNDEGRLLGIVTWRDQLRSLLPPR